MIGPRLAPVLAKSYNARLLATLTLLGLDRIITGIKPYLTSQNIASGAIAVYLTTNLMLPSFASNWIMIGWVALLISGIASWLSSTRPLRVDNRWLLGALGLLLLSHFIAIPFGSNIPLTAGVALWMAPALLLYLIRPTMHVFTWLMPVFWIHAGVVIYQGFTNWSYGGGKLIWAGAPTGLANNPNIAAGFLVLGLVYLLTTPSKPNAWMQWLSAPLIIALLFTGSRWGIAVGVVAVLLMALANRIDARTLAMGVAGLAVAFLLVASLTPNGYQVAGYDSFAGVVHSVNRDVSARLAMPHLPSILPSGVAEHPGLHNVPLRIAVENGLIAAVLWVAISLWALARKVGSTAWWLLVTLVLLSMLDYYSWMGHLGAFWWLLVGVLASPSPDPDWQEARTEAA